MKNNKVGENNQIARVIDYKEGDDVDGDDERERKSGDHCQQVNN